MPTIVERISDNRRFILLGAGFGAWQADGHATLGDWINNRPGGTLEGLCVCDEKGQIGWIDADDARVLTVDGCIPSSALESNQ